MKSLVYILSILFFITGCSSKQPQKLEEAFLLSIQKNDFGLLKSFLPDKEFYLSLGDKMPKRTDEEITKFLDESNERVKEAWQNTIYNAAQKKIDLGKLTIKEVIYHDPFPRDESSEAMIIDYEYEGSVWDDLQFIVGRYKEKTYLLGIPNPTRAFSMTDPDLRATNEARAWVELKTPAFKKNVEDLSDRIMTAVKEKNLDAFGQLLIYRGEDENRKWKTALNMRDSLEAQQAGEFLQRISQNIEGCTSPEAGQLRTERESEGLWIIQPFKCNGKIVSFAFLRIKDQLLLGDIGVDIQ